MSARWEEVPDRDDHAKPGRFDCFFVAIGLMGLVFIGACIGAAVLASYARYYGVTP